MSKLDSFTRQRYIISKLQKQDCTFEELDNYLKNKSSSDHRKYDCDIRTFQRDTKEIQALFGILIKYNKRDKVYFIEEDNTDEIGHRLLETFDIYKTLNDFERASKYVHFSSRKAIGGQHIYSILTAINNKKAIEFQHKNFWTDVTTTFTIAPYALKEFNGRWYLIGKCGDRILSWGLDRILDLEITKTKFIYPKDFNLNNMYQNSFGIHATDDEDAYKISFITKANKANYFVTMPLHATQTIKQLPNDAVEISVILAPTHDFIMELLSHGHEIKVTAPKVFARQFKARIKEMLELYK